MYRKYTNMWAQNGGGGADDMSSSIATTKHLPDSQARWPRGFRPSLAESVLSSTYWGREDDLDIEYSIIFQQNANLMLAHCLRRWLNINPTLPHATSRVWLDVVGAGCDTSCEILGHQTCAT